MQVSVAQLFSYSLANV